MPQANAIIIPVRASEAQEFERLFQAEELPIWDEFSAEGKFLKARLARIQLGSEERDDVAPYLIYVEVPSMAEHSAHDSDPASRASTRKLASFSPSCLRCSEQTSSSSAGELLGRRLAHHVGA